MEEKENLLDELCHLKKDLELSSSERQQTEAEKQQLAESNREMRVRQVGFTFTSIDWSSHMFSLNFLLKPFITSKMWVLITTIDTQLLEKTTKSMITTFEAISALFFFWVAEMEIKWPCSFVTGRVKQRERGTALHSGCFRSYDRRDDDPT